MTESLIQLFSNEGFVAHGHSYLWTPLLLWTYVVSDALIGLAYFSIPLALIYLVYKRNDLGFNWILMLFSGFIFACGLTHLFSIWTIWHPDYWIDAALKVLTASVSTITATALLLLIPKALKLSSREQLRSVIRQLEHEVAERKAAECAIAALNDSLEQRVEKRTKELLEINHRMEEEINSRKRIEHALHAEKQRIQVTLQSIGDAVITADTNTRVTYLNPIAERMTGWTNAEATGMLLKDIFHIVNEISRERMPCPVELVLAESKVCRLPTHTSTVLINRYGAEFAIEDSAAPLLDYEKTMLGVVLVFHDVSEARKIAQQMAYQANHDSLTDLPNRTLLNDRLAKALTLCERDKKRLALMFLDIDNFKNVNDTLGHDVGDQLLLEISAQLRTVVRSSDTISRQGGDEFIILLPEISDRLAPAEVARKILGAVAGTEKIGGHEVRVTGSIGISVYPDDGNEAEALTKNADSAMYHAKSLGRNNFQFFTNAMTETVTKRVKLENNLRRAIEQNEFILHYQPKIELNTGRIIGAEVLVRWQHPTLGLVPPAQFISAAEQSGLIKPIGSWVLREACAQNQAWQAAGMAAIPMAVNLSAIQLHHEGFLEEVTEVLDDLDLAPQFLEFEVTESVSIHGEAKAVTWLETLKEMGVRLSIDDFGTGYSSLSYLKRLPIDTIKIDQSFIRDITTDPDDAAIITAIIRMAHSLRLNVIAEGVETADQLDFLRDRHCNEVQGHFFSAPVPAAQFGHLLMAQAAMV